MIEVSSVEAAQCIRDGDTIAITGNGGGMLEADEIFAAIEARFLASGHPRDLTLVHALGVGDADRRGVNRFAHEGMVRRVVGGHWSWSPRMQKLARDNKIEAFTLPSGVISLLMRETGAKRPGLITRVGLNTAYDPRLGGGAANDAAKAARPISEIVTLGGEDYIRYLPIRPDIAIVRGTYCDELGNISCAEEAGDLDAHAVALAARNSGGRVLVQVREKRKSSDCIARLVQVPGVLVDQVVLAPNQPQTHVGGYEPSIAGVPHAAPAPDTKFAGLSLPSGARGIIARRAAGEIRAGQSVNFGFGIPGGIAAVLTAQARLKDIWLTVEQGIHNGQLIDGALFGAAAFPSAIMRSTDQFDFYSGGGVDIAFLGAGEIDAKGNVNVSRLGRDVVGPGGFVDISQGAKSVVFCGTFEASGLSVHASGGRLSIDKDGSIPKFVEDVREVTFCGPSALAKGQSVLYVTERAVFRLTKDGLTLVEVAPGIDAERQVLDRMAFRPQVASDLAAMDARCFVEDFGGDGGASLAKAGGGHA
ncbi:acyl CoA:acetate/3-ketoacid CoA transferase [Kangsaoukella pontilimi]|uniref:acyl CoA:acetate/3-ketoacid CoA transferase n=1 Tax=Kangsaoukella pontilimi TaxID=2691042 RepID=UPI0029CA19BF|nr:CoA-transferase [Kangsaoukella pontilimi]